MAFNFEEYNLGRGCVAIDVARWESDRYYAGRDIEAGKGKFEKLLGLYSHPGYMAHEVHLLVAYDLEWNPLEMEDGVEIWVYMFTLDEALAATREDYRCDPGTALGSILKSV